MRPASAAVRSYALFGESGHLPDVVHCETIAARSSLHGWELAPHRHARLHQLLLLREGAGTAWLDGQPSVLAPASLVNVAQGDVHAFRFEPGTQGWVATLCEELLHEILAPAPELRAALARSCVLAADAAAVDAMRALWDAFSAKGRARALRLRGLCTTLLAHVAELADAHPGIGAGTPAHRLLQRFEALLDRHFQERWRVADYARALAVTPTHLSRVSREVTGGPASGLIQARCLREARRHLAYTSLSVGAIAEALGFADAAHFSRVFSRDAGVSPRAFRARLALGSGVRALPSEASGNGPVPADPPAPAQARSPAH